MDVFDFREHLVGQYEQFTRSFAYTEHNPPTTGQYFADYNPYPTTEQRQPFDWNPERFSALHAEFDACYARLGGLTRDELRRILDAKCVMGAAASSGTFRVLKHGQLRAYGESRTRRLVSKAWVKLGRQ